MVTLFIIAALCVFLFLELHHSLTHDCMGRKIKPPANPVYKKDTPQDERPKGRFAFSEETILKNMGKIAERFKMEMSNKTDRDQYGTPYYFVVFLEGKYSFKIRIDDRCISIWACSLTSCEQVKGKNYSCYYYFELLDDYLSSFKAQASTDYEYGYEDNIFASDLSFNDMSDNEIFDTVEKIIEALYGATSMTYETAESEDGKESFTFYLDAPDYYGYSETTEIGNFKFILNKENGGDKNV